MLRFTYIIQVSGPLHNLNANDNKVFMVQYDLTLLKKYPQIIRLCEKIMKACKGWVWTEDVSFFPVE